MMKPSHYLPALAIVLAMTSCKETKSTAGSPAGEAGAETYVLAKADAQPTPGRKYTVDHETVMKNGTVKVNAGGKEMEGTMDTFEKETETMEIVDATTRKLLVTTSEKSQTVTMAGGSPPPQKTPGALLNLPVKLSKADGKWTAALESGTPSGEQQAELSKKEKNLNEDNDLKVYGSEPRKVGDTWTVDASNLGFAEGAPVGQLKMTFKGVETFEGRKCARLEGTVEMESEKSAAQHLSMKGDVTVLRDLEEQQDLKFEMKGKIDVEGKIPGGDMHMSGDMTMSGHTTIQ